MPIVSESSQSSKIQLAQHTSSTVASLTVSAPIAGVLELGSKEEELCAKSSLVIKSSDLSLCLARSRVLGSPSQVRLHLVFHSDLTCKLFSHQEEIVF